MKRELWLIEFKKWNDEFAKWELQFHLSGLSAFRSKRVAEKELEEVAAMNPSFEFRIRKGILELCIAPD